MLRCRAADRREEARGLSCARRATASRATARLAALSRRRDRSSPRPASPPATPGRNGAVVIEARPRPLVDQEVAQPRLAERRVVDERSSACASLPAHAWRRKIASINRDAATSFASACRSFAGSAETSAPMSIGREARRHLFESAPIAEAPGRPRGGSAATGDAITRGRTSEVRRYVISAEGRTDERFGASVDAAAQLQAARLGAEAANSRSHISAGGV